MAWNEPKVPSCIKPNTAEEIKSTITGLCVSFIKISINPLYVNSSSTGAIIMLAIRLKTKYAISADTPDGSDEAILGNKRV